MAEMSIEKKINIIADLSRVDPTVVAVTLAGIEPDHIAQATINLGFVADGGADPKFWHVLRDGWTHAA
jgi:hypothetical protein